MDAHVSHREFHSVQHSHVPREEFFSRHAPSLMLEWILVDDHRMPVRFTQLCGVSPSFDGPCKVTDGSPVPNAQGTIDWAFKAAVGLQTTSAAVVAFDLRFLLFNVWATYTQTLCLSVVRESPPQHDIQVSCRWPFQSHRAGEEHLGSLAYIARVRTSAGDIHEADKELLVCEAKRVMPSFTEACLEAKMSHATT